MPAAVTELTGTTLDDRYRLLVDNISDYAIFDFKQRRHPMSLPKLPTMAPWQFSQPLVPATLLPHR
ncbi:hypothetical protein [Rhizobium sp. RAF56]|jgi:hypothetical protein|uniref:hypothetical protein n=1 Tax=Rhizobium sp. RAF56 TaxID=3233062 RepID=UPI003F943264